MRHNGEPVLDPSAIYEKAATRAEAARARYWKASDDDKFRDGVEKALAKNMLVSQPTRGFSIDQYNEIMAGNLAEKVVITEAVRAAGSHTPAEIGVLVHAAIRTFSAGVETARQTGAQLLAALGQEAGRGLAAVTAMRDLVASGAFGTETFTESFERTSTTGVIPAGPVGKEKPAITETESRHREFKSNLPPNIEVKFPSYTVKAELPTPPPVDAVSTHEADYSFPDGGHLGVFHHVEVHVGTGTGGSILVTHHGGSISRG